MRRSLGLFLASLMFVSIACRPQTEAPMVPIRVHCPEVANAVPLTKAVAEEISFEQLTLMLPKHRIRVGFDVDDTLIFSAPAFNALQPNYDPNVIRPKDYKALTAEQKEKYHEFWDKLNKEYDDRSHAKSIGRRLLN